MRVLLLALILAVPCEARLKWSKIALRASQIALAGSVALDLHSGQIASQRGYSESNGALGQSLGRQVAILGGMAGAQIAVSEWAGRKKCRNCSWPGVVGNFGRAAWHGWAAQHNYRLRK